jgi:predicted ATPase
LLTVARALELLETNQVRFAEAELRRLNGELLLLAGQDSDDAERCFREALAIAQRQEAKWWELRATASLARLLMKQARRNEARSMLAEIYSWFTEGFNTRDLQEAKQLLNELD